VIADTIPSNGDSRTCSGLGGRSDGRELSLRDLKRGVMA
jgi:hypothetical protein